MGLGSPALADRADLGTGMHGPSGVRVLWLVCGMRLHADLSIWRGRIGPRQAEKRSWSMCIEFFAVSYPAQPIEAGVGRQGRLTIISKESRHDIGETEIDIP